MSLLLKLAHPQLLPLWSITSIKYFPFYIRVSKSTLILLNTLHFDDKQPIFVVIDLLKYMKSAETWSFLEKSKEADTIFDSNGQPSMFCILLNPSETA